MTTNQQLADGLTAVNSQLDKIAAESRASVEKIAQLEAAIANSPNGSVSPEVDAAFQALKQRVQGVDDLVADAQATPQAEADTDVSNEASPA